MRGRAWRARVDEGMKVATGIEAFRRQQWRLRCTIPAAWGLGLGSEGNERGDRGHLIGGADREFPLLEDAD